MGDGFLIDTNAVIDYLSNRLTEPGMTFLGGLPPRISVITRIELLGWFGISNHQLEKLQSFITGATIYALDEAVIQSTIFLRQRYKLKTPDAIIAATALIQDFTLVTRNISDFEKIAGLICINPHQLNELDL